MHCLALPIGDFYQTDLDGTRQTCYTLNMKRETFQSWMRKVNRVISNRIGVDTNDMPDVCARDLFEDELTPEEAAQEIMEMWVDGGDLGEDLL